MKISYRYNKNTPWLMAALGIAFILAIAIAFSVLGGWLVTVVAGIFGFEMVLWQGIACFVLLEWLLGTLKR